MVLFMALFYFVVLVALQAVASQDAAVKEIFLPRRSNLPFLESEHIENSTKAKISITHDKIFSVVSKRFLSFAIHAKAFARRSPFLYHDATFLTLCKGLSMQKGTDSNIYLRAAGNAANKIYFRKDSHRLDDNHHDKFFMNPLRWDNLMSFVSKLGWKLLFGLNGLPRKADGSWDYSNPLEFLQYARSRGDDVDYELGNEPDLYKEHNISLSASQVARDFELLHTLASDVMPNSKIIGPDISHIPNNTYFLSFLKEIKPDAIDAVSWHFYYKEGSNITLSDYTNPKFLDSFLRISKEAINMIKNANGTRICPVWIGETADGWGGGAAGLSDSYAAGFTYLDKLGLGAVLNINVVVRQAIIGANYALLDRNDNFFPRPCYWLSSLYKLFVGERVLEVNGSTDYNREVRVYAHCINKDGRHSYEKGSIVLLVINLHATNKAIIELDAEIRSLPVHQYLLEPSQDVLASRYVKLNDRLLELVDNTTMPSYEPRVVKQPFLVPPVRYGFFVIPSAGFEACL